MARTSKIQEIVTEVVKLTKDQLLSQLDLIDESAGNLVRQYFGQRQSTRVLKRYQVPVGFESLPVKTPDNAKHVFEVLKSAGQPLTIDEWADKLRVEFTGKSQHMPNVIRANKAILDALSAIEEV